MSRIGRMPIPIPKGVAVTIDPDNTVTVTAGPKALAFRCHTSMTVREEEGSLLVERPSDRKMHKQLHGTTRAILASMVHGVSEGFERILEVHGLGYRAALRGKDLVLQVGYSHEVVYTPAEGLEIVTEGTNPVLIRIRGTDKQKVGQAAAEIRRVRSVEPYKGKGIRYRGERVRLKAGKAGRAAK
jgi:large subunit ribosomal protein L6